MSETDLRRVLAIFALMLGGLLGVACTLDAMLSDPPGRIRHDSFRNRVECLLEKWGVIKPDPFRHVVG